MARFVKATGLTLVSRLAGRAVGLIATVLLARVLGPEGHGHYTLAFLLASVAVALFNLGLPATSIYYVARRPRARPQIMGHLFLFLLGAVGGAMLIGWGLAFYGQTWFFPQTPRVYLLWGIGIIPGMMAFRVLQGVLLGLQRFEMYNGAQVGQSVARVLWMAILVGLLRVGVRGAIVAEAVSWLVGVAWLWYALRRALPRWSWRWDARLAREMLTYGWQTYVGNLLAFFNYRADVFLMNHFLGPRAVGIYAVAVALVERLWLVSQTASTVLLPRVSASNDPAWKQRFTTLIARTVLVLVVPAAVALALGARPLVIGLYSAAFADAVWPLRILLVGIVSFSVSRVLAQDIAGRGRPDLNAYTSALALGVNLALNLWLLPHWGLAAAALASSVSYTTLLLSKLVFYTRLVGSSWREVLVPRPSDWQLYRAAWHALFREASRRLMSHRRG